MCDKETNNTIKDYAIDTRVALDLLIKVSENDDIAPSYYAKAISVLDEAYTKLENILRKLGR